MINSDGELCIILSERAYKNYSPEQQELLRANYRLIVSNVETIEFIGGGSCRCMLAEDFSSYQE